MARELWEELQIKSELFFPQPIFLTVTETVGATAGAPMSRSGMFCAAIASSA